MTDIVPAAQSSELAADMEYARVVSSGAMLPTQYRGKPADILIAMGLGRAMGLSPAESLYRIHVIQGRPTASAELIAANVRKAGHLLRVKGDETSARAVIIRSDDPDFEFESVWDMERAKRLGLAGKDGWQKQPGTMMRWRAITEVARLACPEALYGVAYVAEEIGDLPRTETTTTRVSADDFLQTSAQPEPVADVTDAEVLEDEPQPEPKLSARNRGRLFALFTQKGAPESEQLAFIARVIGRTPTHRDAINEDEFARVVHQLESLPDAQGGPDA